MRFHLQSNLQSRITAKLCSKRAAKINYHKSQNLHISILSLIDTTVRASAAVFFCLPLKKTTFLNSATFHHYRTAARIIEKRMEQESYSGKNAEKDLCFSPFCEFGLRNAGHVKAPTRLIAIMKPLDMKADKNYWEKRFQAIYNSLDDNAE